MNTRCCLALLLLVLAPAAPAGAEEVLLYTTKDPDQVRAVRANGNRDRLLFQGGILEFARTKLGQYVGTKGEVLGPSRYWTSITTETRYDDQLDARPTEEQLVEVFEGRKTVIVPWTRFRFGSSIYPSHRGRYVCYTQRRIESPLIRRQSERGIYFEQNPDYAILDLYVAEMDGTGTPRRVARNVSAARWVTLPEEAELEVEPLPAEVWLERKTRRPAQPVGEDENAVPSRPVNWTRAILIGGEVALEQPSAQRALDSMAPADQDAFARGYEVLKRRLHETKGVFNVTRYASLNRDDNKWSCVSASEDRAKDFSSYLDDHWTMISVTGLRPRLADLIEGFVSVPGAHTFNVAVFSASDGQTIHVAVDNYVGIPMQAVLGTSEADWPPNWYRNGENADFRTGAVFPRPPSGTDAGITAQEVVEASALRAQSLGYDKVELDPAVALAYGVTLLPFRVSLRTLDGDPHAEQLVTITTSSPRCSLSDTRALSVALGEPARSQTSLQLRVGSAGVSGVVYLVVKDPAAHGHDPESVSVTVEAEGSSVEHTWDVEDNLEQLKKRFRLRAQDRFPRGSIERLAMDLSGPYEREAYLDDVFVASVGNGALDAGGMRELVLEELEAMRADGETKHYFSGLNYMSLADTKQGAVCFPVAIYSPTSPERNLILDPLPREDGEAKLAFLAGLEEPDFAQSQLAEATLRRGTSILVSCPVEVTFTDAGGKRVGYTKEGHVNELEEAGAYGRTEYLEADGTRAKLVELGECKGQLEITAEADGSFSLDLLYHQPDGTALWVSWVNVPVVAGEVLTFPIDPEAPGQPALRESGELVAPAAPPVTVQGQRFATGGGSGGGGGCSLSPQASLSPGWGAFLLLALGLFLARRRVAELG